ncbi:MAG: ankyrin repeat domain-containing protein [Verrucomicrobiota bacterium]
MRFSSEILQKLINADDLDGLKEIISESLSKQENQVLSEFMQGVIKKENLPSSTMLVRAGFDVNWFDDDHFPALIYAVESRNEDICHMLMQHGASAETKGNFGKTALMLAARDGNKGIIELLLDHHAEINAQSNDGWTPLMFATFNDYTEICELLLMKGADATLKNSKQHTALCIAKARGNSQVLHILETQTQSN